MTEVTSIPERFFRYSLVSVVSTVLGLSLLYAFNALAGVYAPVANLLAAVVGTPPIYLLSRDWAWQGVRLEQESEAFMKFVTATAASVLVSTVVVFVADRLWGDGAIAVAAAFFGYGLAWVFRFFLLDKVVFSQ